MSRRASFGIVAVVFGFFAVTTSAQPGIVIGQMKAVFSAPDFQQTVRKFETRLNLATAVGAEDIALAPSVERWDTKFREKQSAILGGIYLAKGSESLRVGPGGYLVQATPIDGGATWTLFDSNGNPKSVGLKVEVRQNQDDADVPVPLARIQSIGARRRCCFKVDHIEHCGECN